MSRVPLYEDATWSDSVRAPRSEKERVAYEEVVDEAEARAATLDVSAGTWQGRLEEWADRNRAWAKERAERLHEEDWLESDPWTTGLWLDGVMTVAFILEVQRRYAEREHERRLAALSREWPPPEAQPFGVSHEGAEALVAVWMRHLGAGDAQVTQYGHDGGIDVESMSYIAQVKNYSMPVGVEPVRELAGTAAVDGRTPLFFAASGYAPGALEFATRARIAAFAYNAVEGTLSAANSLAEDILENGL